VAHDGAAPSADAARSNTDRPSFLAGCEKKKRKTGPARLFGRVVAAPLDNPIKLLTLASLSLYSHLRSSPQAKIAKQHAPCCPENSNKRRQQWACVWGRMLLALVVVAVFAK
jgi:hypothetical protein